MVDLTKGAPVKRIALSPLLVLLTACSPYDFDQLGGVELGEAGGAVYGTSAIGEVMFVFSDIPDICEQLYSAEPPQFSDWWLVSAWTRSAPRTDSDLPASGFGAVSVLDEVSEYRANDAGVTLSKYAEDYAEGEVWINFDNEDVVKAEFEAVPCAAPMFMGLE